MVLCREPVNTMSLSFWHQLSAALDELEADPEASLFPCFCFWTRLILEPLYSPADARKGWQRTTQLGPLPAVPAAMVQGGLA